jgi:ubiquinone/menaquinone biosynthesis C-methylase UbiE
MLSITFARMGYNTAMSALTWDNLYSEHPDAYELLVSHEDYRSNLMTALERIQPLTGAVVAEFGCGTGRVTALLARRAARIHAFDFTAAMLGVAQEKRRRLGWTNVSLTLADSRAIPARRGWADFAVEGWAFLQIAVWHPADWQTQLGRALEEMRRVVRPGGKMILIETLGTGRREPDVPRHFRQVYDWLETEHGFAANWIRTDYRFETMKQVREVIVPLFGEEMLATLEQDETGILVPECTGLWWREN